MRVLKGGYSLEVSGSDGKKVLWESVCDNVVEGVKEHYEIGLWGFDFIFFDEYEEGDGR